MAKTFRMRIEFDVTLPGNPRTPPAWVKRLRVKLDDAIEHAMENEVKTSCTVRGVRMMHRHLLPADGGAQ